MFGFGKTKRENQKLKQTNNILKKAYSDSKKEKVSLIKTMDRLASDGLRHGSPEAGKYMAGKRKK